MRSRTPKVLHEICGLPMVLWPVRAALAAGAGRVVVVDSPARALEEVLPEGVELAVQERPDGTGGAVAAAMATLDSGAGSDLDRDAPVVVLSGDVPLVSAEAIGGLIDAHRAERRGGHDGEHDPGRSERLRAGGARRGAARCERVVETKSQGDSTQAEREIREVNTGIFVFDARALRAGAAAAQLRQRPGGALPAAGARPAQGGRGERGRAPRRGRATGARGQRPRGARPCAGGSPSRRSTSGTCARASRIVDPAATVIDVDVEIGQDTVIEPFTTIRGRTQDRPRLHDQALLPRGLRARGRRERRAVRLPAPRGRPARGRPRSGTFVEVKNSDIGAGAKVPHLSYIGDADVGEGTNLGAATITANYDGRAKHRTTVGRRRAHGRRHDARGPGERRRRRRARAPDR